MPTTRNFKKDTFVETLLHSQSTTTTVNITTMYLRLFYSCLIVLVFIGNALGQSKSNRSLTNRCLLIDIDIETCEDFSSDPSNCTMFIRCFFNLRIKFTCPIGTAWEMSLKTCVWKEYVESCQTLTRKVQQTELGKKRTCPYA
jgi:hypothetical protein